MIAKEGLKIILLLSSLTFLGLFLRNYFISAIFALLLFFTLFFLRDPKRDIKTEEDKIVSPADGKIIEISNENGKTEISIFMSITDVHVNRVPLSGQVTSIRRSGSKFMRAFLKEADFHNVQCETIILSPFIGEYSVIQISGIIARRIVNNLRVGMEVKTGQRMGIILYGSKVKIILPQDKVEVLVKEGERVKAGITYIARIK
uniref:Phosphatidylserine decarboxylase n=1 Tax=candidate division WOR-3 bacterium TaxID=2052148 RepID=A0A7C2K2Q2_UNCW3